VTHRRDFARSLGIGLGLFSAHASAGPGDASRLEYARDERAQQCPDRAALREAVSKRLGYDPFFPAARQAVVVEITSVDDGLHAELRLLDENGIIRGSRQLHERPGHCDELVASLALAISIALDPAAGLALTESAGEPAPATEAGATNAEADAADARETPTQVEPPRPPQPPRGKARAASASTGAGSLASLLSWRAQGFAALGNAPSPAVGFRVAAGLRGKWLALSGEFADQFPSSRAVAGGGRARASLLSATLVPCVVHGWASGCVLASFGSLTTEGEQIPAPFRQSTAQVTVGARLGYTPALTRHFRLMLDLDVLKPLLPVTLRLREQDVWHAPLLSYAAGLGLEVQFP
jgi:hypothetical protein